MHYEESKNFTGCDLHYNKLVITIGIVNVDYVL